MDVSVVSLPPGDKYPCCALLSVLPAKGVSLQDVEREAMQVLDSLASEGITEKELQRIKKVSLTSKPYDQGLQPFGPLVNSGYF